MRVTLLVLFALIYCFVSVASIKAATTHDNNPKTAGQNIGSQVQSNWTSEEGFKNMTKAITTGKIPLWTLDRSKSGYARIMCPGSGNVFEILIQPKSTGDLSFISVAYDSNLDGNFDGRYVVPGPVSGVCANGFVKCNAGTWQNCHWFEWRFVNNEITAVEVAPHQLGGCYCINRGCTRASFFEFKDQVLRSLAGGVAEAMASANPRLAIARAEIEGTVIRGYAQNVGSCSMASGTLSRYSLRTPENFYKNSALLTSTAQSEVIHQSNDPNSLYYLVTHSSAFTGAGRTTCDLFRTAYYDNNRCEVREDISNRCVAYEQRSDCRLEEEVAYDSQGNSLVTYRDFNPTGLTLLPSCKSIFVDPYCSFTSSPSGWTCSGGVIGPTRQGSSAISFKGTAQTAGGSATIVINLTQEQINSLSSVTVYWCTNTYSAWPCFDDDTTVTVWVNGQRAFRAGRGDCEPCSWSRRIPISLFRPGANTIKFHDSGGNKSGYGCRPFTITFLFRPEGVEKEVCYPWWRKKRTYVCKLNESMSPDVRRAEVISGTLTEGSGSYSYQDIAYGSGQVQIFLHQEDTCMPACKLRKIEQPAQATQGATTADIRGDPATQVVIYRTCVDGRCPVNPGEEVLEDCRCIHEFNLAVGTMQTLRQAGIDLTCSSGQKY